MRTTTSRTTTARTTTARATTARATAARATAARTLRRLLALATLPALAGACGDDSPVAPDATAEAVATLRRVTERYHDLNAAKADGFVFVHGCETRPGKGQVGMLYVHMGRLTDGRIDPTAPDALVYEPGPGGSGKLVAVELAVPYPLWTSDAPPTFLGQSFQREDEFGVFGLHVWVWRDNPRGLFAEGNPNIACAA